MNKDEIALFKILPVQIENKENMLLELHNKVELLNKEYRMLELKEIAAIENAVGPEGKKLYSNQLKRDIALKDVKNKSQVLRS